MSDLGTSDPRALERPLEPSLGTSDRLAQVQPRITYVIHLWLEDAIGHKTIGPFTLAEVNKIQATLTCKHHTERITTDVPTWATREPVPTSLSDSGAIIV